MVDTSFKYAIMESLLLFHVFFQTCAPHKYFFSLGIHYFKSDFYHYEVWYKYVHQFGLHFIILTPRSPAQRRTNTMYIHLMQGSKYPEASI